MKLSIGNRIAALRKEKGMTQEQLAMELGVSAPAVSKWETDSSYPDITLLCPLARALGTDIDTLLKYEKNISEEKVTGYVEQIINIRQKKGIEEAEKQLNKILHQYPNSISLKYHAVALFTNFEIQNPQADEMDKAKWRRQKKELLEDVYKSKDKDYFQLSVCSLAALALSENRLEEAERLLGELPETFMDATGLWVQLYEKKNMPQKATEILQRKMYTLVNQMLSCLTMMIEKTLPEDEKKVLELCSVYQKLEDIIYTGKGNCDIVLAEVYAKLGMEQEAANFLISYLEGNAKELPLPNPLLFAPTIPIARVKQASASEMKEMMLRGILYDDALSKLCERQDVKSAIQKYENSNF